MRGQRVWHLWLTSRVGYAHSTNMSPSVVEARRGSPCSAYGSVRGRAKRERERETTAKNLAAPRGDLPQIVAMSVDNWPGDHPQGRHRCASPDKLARRQGHGWDLDLQAAARRRTGAASRHAPQPPGQPTLRVLCSRAFEAAVSTSCRGAPVLRTAA